MYMLAYFLVATVFELSEIKSYKIILNWIQYVKLHAKYILVIYNLTVLA